MHEDPAPLASFVAFASVGAFAVAQELAAAVLDGTADSRPDLVVEETLCLVCMVSARAAAFGFRDRPDTATRAETILADLPFTWRDYHVAGEMLDHEAGAPPEAAEALYERLGRKTAFYGAHFPPGAMPGERSLTEKMALWMGRVSPPGLHEMPDARLARLGLVPILARHARLVREFAAQRPA